MKKRLRKKYGTQYNLSKYVRRQMYNRKGGLKYIAYKVIPMGENDKLDFSKEYGLDFPYATHWFVEIFQQQYWGHYVIQIYPSTSKGRIRQKNFFVRIFSADKADRNDIFLVFEKIEDDMKNDKYMKNDAVYYYDNLL